MGKGLHPGAEGTQGDLLLTAMDLEHTTQPASSSAGLACLTVDGIGEGFPVGPVLALDYLPLITFPRGPTVCVHCSLKVVTE